MRGIHFASFAPAAADMILRMAPFLLAVCGLAATVMACGANRNVYPTATVDLSGVTVDQAYARMAQAMMHEGQVLHTRFRTSTLRYGESELLPYSTTDLWIDGSARKLREEFRLDPSVDAYDLATESTLIVVDQYVYTPDDPDEALRSDVKYFCPQNSDPLIAYLLECEGMQLRQESAATRTRFDADREYQGRPAAALVFEMDGEVFQGTFTTYIDPVTFLPMARTAEPTSRGGFPRSVAEYEHEFVNAGSLDQSTFDPRSIGYGAEDEQAKLDAIAKEVPVWWLGNEFKPASPWGELVLTRIFGADPWGSDGHLVYETPSGLEGADILLWTPAHFDAFIASQEAAVLSDPLCVTHTTLKTGQRDVDLYAIPWPAPPVNTAPQTPEEACPIRIVNAVLQGWSYVAVVRMDNVVIDVRIPQPAGHAYASEDGVNVLVDALRARPAAATGTEVATPTEPPPTTTPVPPVRATAVLVVTATRAPAP